MNTQPSLLDFIGDPAAGLPGRAVSVSDLRQEGMFRQLCRLFQQHQIDFCPIKGADLAWRVYPRGMVRLKCDLDILIRRADCDRVQRILAAEGWQAPYRYRLKHHEAVMRKLDVSLELHTRLPNFDRVDPDHVWDEIPAVDGSRHQLPLEMNLLMLFNHARGAHQWENGRYLVLDSYFLMQTEGAPDWPRLEAMARRFKVSTPALLFDTFREYFPPEWLPETTFPDPVRRLFRELLLTPAPEAGNHELVMSSGNRFSLQWWLNRLNGMRPSSIRIQTRNPSGNYLKLLAGYWRIGTGKLRDFWRLRHGTADAGLRRRIRQLEAIEKIITPK